MALADSFSSVTDFQNCQESAVHKVAAISIAGQEMLRAVMRVQAIVCPARFSFSLPSVLNSSFSGPQNNARSSNSGNDPRDYLSLEPSAGVLEPELCHSIVEVARNFGRVLGLAVDRNSPPALGKRQHHLYNVSSSDSSGNPSQHHR